MNNPIIKDIIREIKNTKSRFLSIFGIILIGVTFFSGIVQTSPDMKNTADLYFDEYNLMDYTIYSTLGITKDDINQLRNIDNIDGVYPGYSDETYSICKDEKHVTKVYSYNLKNINDNSDDYINKFILKEGRLPKNDHEVLVIINQNESNNLKIKDVIRFESDNIVEKDYEIVGLVYTPYYLSNEYNSTNNGLGLIENIIYIDESNFNYDIYTEVYLTASNSKKYNSFENEYFEYLKPITNNIEILGNKRSQLRQDEIILKATSELNIAKNKYQDGLLTFKNEIKDAEAKLDKANDTIILGEAEIIANKAILESEIQQANIEIKNGEDELKKLDSKYKELVSENLIINKDIILQIDTLTSKKMALETKINVLKPNADIINNSIKSKQQDIETNLLSINNNLLTITKNKTRIKEIDDYLLANGTDTILENEKKQLELENTTLENNNIGLKNTNDNLLTEINLLNNDSDYIEYNNKNNELTTITYQINILNKSMETTTKIERELKIQLDKANQKLIDGKSQLIEKEELAKIKLQEAQQAIVDSKEVYAKSIKDLEIKRNDGQKQLDNTLHEIKKAEYDISLLDNAKWIVLDRNSHYSYRDYLSTTQRMQAIAKVFPIFFFVIAALVCLTTMTRLVDERRLQIGTMKALGYSNYIIILKYVFYAASASVLGAIFGLLIGMSLFPLVLYRCWNLMYNLPNIIYHDPSILLIITSILISCIVTIIATIIVCLRTLDETPSALARLKAPKHGKKIMLERIDFIWKRLSFTFKVTFRNILRYKTKMLMTIIGIAGCTALLTAGFGIQDAISDIATIQYEDIVKHDGYINITEDININNQLNDINSITDYTYLSTYVTNIENNDININIITNIEDFNKFYSLHSRVDKKELLIDNKGIYVSEQLASNLNITSGDHINLINNYGVSKEVKINGIFENYIYHNIFMTSYYYNDIFEDSINNNTVLFKLNNLDNLNSIQKQILILDDVNNVTFYNTFIVTFLDMINSISIIVVILVISAGLLSLIVLYNLTVVNISERIREIATLKVLGFNDQEVKKYIFLENIILSFVGCFIGLFIGKYLHLIIMIVVELDNIMFGRNIDLSSYLIAFIITIVFTLISNLLMSKMLVNVKMVESLKSIE